MKSMFAFMGLLLIGVFNCGVATAQTSEWNPRSINEMAQAIDAEYKKVVADPAQLDAMASSAFGSARLSQGKLAASRRYWDAILGHSKLPMAIAKMTFPIYKPGISMSEVMAGFKEASANFRTRGLQRLPRERQERFLDYAAGMFRAMPPDACKRLSIGRMGSFEARQYEAKHLLNQSDERFEEMLNLYGDAIAAELAAYPSAPSLNNKQAELAEQVFGDRFISRLAKGLSTQAIDGVVSNMDGAPARDVCEFNATALEAIADMTQPYKDWLLTKRFSEMQ